MKLAARKACGAMIFGLISSASIAEFNPTDPGLTSSEGNLKITLNVAQGIQIQGLTDIALDLNGIAAGNDLIGRDTFCVGAIGFSNYKIQFDSATAPTDGYLLDGVGETLAYNVAFSANTANTATGVQTNSDGTMTSTYTPNTGYSCADSEHNAQVIVTVPAAVWETASELSYSDTLTITVSGE
ncbi:hypothetical protein [Microbulbifer sp. YPW1]|uniref:hypothetical protein n=1 Tax=Microbulbifer sp. YPW1 TaxID=2745199 RepID=UPI00159AD249|nr:hypothetical protein [Microbulbifer sp. YPW1]QKX15842.1 hypothetical protein HUW35_01830 [Microbulbifer sp. YPW1]